MMFFVTRVVEARLMQNLWTAIAPTRLSINRFELIEIWLEYTASVCFCDIRHPQTADSKLEVVMRLTRPFSSRETVKFILDIYTSISNYGGPCLGSRSDLANCFINPDVCHVGLDRT